MNVQILSAANSDERAVWLECWEHLPLDRRDVYFMPGFLLANEAEGRGRAQCFVARAGDALLLYPFLLNPVPESAMLEAGSPLFDIQTPYGYGGPVVNHAGENPDFLEAAWKVFSAWCVERKIVAEFCRFHPLFENERWAGASMRVISNRTTVFIDLTSYPTDYSQSPFFANHRQMVNKALRAGYRSETIPADGQMDWFAGMYARTQDLLNANAETRFGEVYLRTLTQQLGSRATLRVVRRNERIATATLMLESDQYIHGHLLVYGEDRASSGATDELQHGLALDAAKRGLKILHIGGGRTSSPDDSLFKFKAKVSPGRALFLIGTRRPQPELFDRMKAVWESRFGPAPKGFFLFYRAEPKPSPNE